MRSDQHECRHSPKRCEMIWSHQWATNHGYDSCHTDEAHNGRKPVRQLAQWQLCESHVGDHEQQTSAQAGWLGNEKRFSCYFCVIDDVAKIFWWSCHFARFGSSNCKNMFFSVLEFKEFYPFYHATKRTFDQPQSCRDQRPVKMAHNRELFQGSPFFLGISQSLP